MFSIPGICDRSLRMADGNSVTQWLGGLKDGDDRDIQQLWDRYFRRLVRLAGATLPGHARRSFDEEDIALSAFHSFCDGVGRGQFPKLDDRGDLWKLLATITKRKVMNSVRRQMRQKRGQGRVLGESAFGNGHGEAGDGVSQFLSREPGPDEAALFADSYERLLAKLEDPVLKTVALRKLDGQSVEAIAVEMGVTTRTIGRKLHLIRAIWEEELLR